MAMDGKELVEKLAKLSQVQSIKDIPQLTHALFPGTHCPLMGAAMAVGGIKDSLIVVVGTDECTYYTKSMTIHSEKFGGIVKRIRYKNPKFINYLKENKTDILHEELAK